MQLRRRVGGTRGAPPPPVAEETLQSTGTRRSPGSCGIVIEQSITADQMSLGWRRWLRSSGSSGKSVWKTYCLEGMAKAALQRMGTWPHAMAIPVCSPFPRQLTHP
jgi:hypothetical protein